MTKVAFLGLGTMGAGMAGQLLAKGFDLTVWNRSAEKAASLAAEGASVGATPALAAAGADIVISMLADDSASRAAWLGEEGALAAMAEGGLAIECSTVTAEWVNELAAAGADRSIAVLDAPVTGSKAQAASGGLRFLVGGPVEALDRARGVFDAMGNEILSCGPTGSGALLKLLNNYLCGVEVAALAEVIAFAEQAGLDVGMAIKVIAEGAPGSPIVRTLAQRMTGRDYTPHFFPALMAKDVRYAGEAMAREGMPSALAQAAEARFLAADEQGFGALDIATVIEPLRRAKH
ncbi:NAD(P)-dependent oxidoreductase [Sphingomonas sp. BIUV-7]|uniref:NAD(P)-dependent oxidoreductase n=1 Tax=Sphingomonas natans TaxID=3063330 RepID=A0ABT8Y3E2_9SPHN|nr:NAD(P)-dependent oxidoreductase [Sphingomonas sp. BIUV-7]MDO6412825.1 NAD(P)-dependent oxidoreductase [Sphingomonas sp. BIUV-7]